MHRNSPVARLLGFGDSELAVPWDTKWKEHRLYPGYWISDTGHIFSMKALRILRPMPDPRGRLFVRITVNGITRALNVEKLRKEYHGDSARLAQSQAPVHARPDIHQPAVHQAVPVPLPDVWPTP